MKLIGPGRLAPGEVERMFDRIAGPYDRMNRVMTAGLDRSWRVAAAAETGLGRGASAIDVCCGTGDLTFAVDPKSLGATSRTDAIQLQRIPPHPIPLPQGEREPNLTVSSPSRSSHSAR